MTAPVWLDRVQFGPDGLVPVVAQDARTGNILMLAYANRAALEQTWSSGEAYYFSRSRGAMWRKGETSGHRQRVAEVRLDCDGDTVLYRVEQTGPACHTGQPTCFSDLVTRDGTLVSHPEVGSHPLTRLANTVADRAARRPEGSYTARLLDSGTARISQKVGEEAVELVVAANAEDDARLASEAADLLYHLIVLLAARSVPLDAVWGELESRERK